jgi:hypothetical protein
MKLIVNADDFGLSEGVNRGIILAHNQGIVTSTTAMVTMPWIDHGVSLLKDAPGLKVGLHLNMTLGKPLTDCPSLVKANGDFYKPKEHPDVSKFAKEEIKKEFWAQYDLFLLKFKMKPTHLDTHLYSHQKYGIVGEIVMELSKKLGIPVRDQATEGFQRVRFLDWFKVLANESVTDVWDKIDEHREDFSKSGVAELMVHPALRDEYLMSISSYNVQRSIELAVLTDEKMKRFVSDHKIELTDYEEESLCLQSN